MKDKMGRVVIEKFVGLSPELCLILVSDSSEYKEAKGVRKNPAGNCMFKVNNRNTRTRCEICSKLTIKTPERR